ncbi:MAG: hypothetical protein ABJA67_07340 [Chthonomonadales bacterium]
MSVSENFLALPATSDYASRYSDFTESISQRSWAAHKQTVALYRNAHMGDKRTVAASLIALAATAIEDGNYLFARTNFAEALAIFRSLKDQRALPYVLERFARLVCLQGNCEAAARLVGAASVLREMTGAQPTGQERNELEDDLITLNEKLGEGALQSAWNKGKRMSAEKSIEFALKYSR